jgi:hypothetical protein
MIAIRGAARRPNGYAMRRFAEIAGTPTRRPRSGTLASAAAAGDLDERDATGARLRHGDEAPAGDPLELLHQGGVADDAPAVAAATHDEVHEPSVALAGSCVGKRAGRRHGGRGALAEAATRLSGRRAQVAQLEPVLKSAVDHRDDPVACQTASQAPCLGLGDGQLMDMARVVPEVELPRRGLGRAAEQQRTGDCPGAPPTRRTIVAPKT